MSAPFSPCPHPSLAEKDPAGAPPDATQRRLSVFDALDAHLARVHPAQPSCRELGEVALAHAAGALSAALALRKGLAVSESDCRGALLDVLGFEGPAGEHLFSRALCELESAARR